MNELPDHIQLTPTQPVHGTCSYCGARVHVGQYPDPTRADTVLAEWIARHIHGVTVTTMIIVTDA